jgi:adenosylmethionine-8-amino-7-oxononanoate aminotransferase
LKRYAPEEIARLREADQRHVWHPFTQMKDWAADSEDPLVVAYAEGCNLFDVGGKKYIDGVSSLWVNVHGHRHPALDAALVAQVGEVAHSTLLGLANVPAIRLAERLVGIAPPGLTRVFYSDSGSTAVEIALKIAFQYWQQRGEPRRTKFLALREAYHGDTIGSVSLGGMDVFHRIFRPLLFDALRAPAPYCYRCELGKTWPACALACAEDLAATVRAHGAELAAVVVEPLVMGAAGMITAPPGWLARVRAACDETGALLVCDEVATGFGRTGKMFASEHEGVAPDLMAVAKGLSGGYLPLAATLATERVYEAFLGEYSERRTFFHGHTYTGNPLACAVALANLELFEQERTLERLQPKIALLAELLAPLASHPHVGEVRQRGFMVGIELVAERAGRRAYPFEERRGARVAREARRRGAIVRPLGDVVVLMPPLAIDDETLRALVRIVRAGIDAATLDAGAGATAEEGA